MTSPRTRILLCVWASVICGAAWTVLPAVWAPGVGPGRYASTSLVFLLLPVFALWFVRREAYGYAALFLLVGGVLTLPCGAFAILGSFAARRESVREKLAPKDAMLCLKCGYDLRGAPVPRCPECGCLYGFTKTAEELGLDEGEQQTMKRL